MRTDRRELVANWLVILGAVGLFVSLFLPWSHQFSAAFLAEWGASDQLRGIPHDPTAWQVYSSADVLLALLAIALVAVALKGTRRVRAGAVAAAAIGLAFTLHALSTPPTNGANIFDPSLSVPNYFPNTPTAGMGETLAAIALGVSLIGLAVSFTAD
ncbi:MAG: hypothetical protein ACR2JH_09480 [Solirubrobacteraceae bacterium]